MGSSKTTQNTNQTQSSNQMNRTVYNPISGTEQQIINQYNQLGNQQLSFLNDLIRGGRSPFALNAADQAQLDAAYNSAFTRFGQEGKDYADYLATTRGLNKSDTPVSQQAMERYGLGMADLLSQRANAGLNMGLQGTGLRMQGSQMLPAGLGAAFAPLFNERMASGIQMGSGSSNMAGSTTLTQKPSLMQQISQGMALGSQAIGLGAQVGGMMMGIPMPSMGSGFGAANTYGLGGLSNFTTNGTGMGSGASANRWFS